MAAGSQIDGVSEQHHRRRFPGPRRTRPRPQADRPAGRNLLFLGGGGPDLRHGPGIWSLSSSRGSSGLLPAWGLITSVWAVAAILSIFVGLGSQNYLTRELVARPASAPRPARYTAIVLRVIMARPSTMPRRSSLRTLPTMGTTAKLTHPVAGRSARRYSQSSMILSCPPLPGRRERMQYSAYSDVINQSAQGLVGILVVVVGLGAVGLTATWLAASVLVFALGVHWIRPLVRVHVPHQCSTDNFYDARERLLSPRSACRISSTPGSTR